MIWWHFPHASTADCTEASVELLPLVKYLWHSPLADVGIEKTAQSALTTSSRNLKMQQKQALLDARFRASGDVIRSQTVLSMTWGSDCCPDVGALWKTDMAGVVRCGCSWSFSSFWWIWNAYICCWTITISKHYKHNVTQPQSHRNLRRFRNRWEEK